MSTGEDEYLDDFDAQQRIGEKVLEMCDRLKPVAKCAPGARASWRFEIDGEWFWVEVTLDDAKARGFSC